MKKMLYLFALSLLLLFALQAKAQYESCFGKTSTQWNIANPDHGTNVYPTYGDTIIDQKQCIKIAGSTYLWEDTTKGELWTYNIYNGKEYMLMNLSLEKGDTFYGNPKTLGTGTITVDSVYYDSLNRKIVKTDYLLHFGLIAYYLTFIEGVGANAGILYQDSYNRALLLCLYKDEILSYSNTEMDGVCNYEAPVNIEKIKAKKYKDRIAYMGDKIFLQFNEEFTGFIRIINSNGQVLNTGQLNKVLEYNLSLGNLATGVYVIQVTDNKGLYCLTKKIHKK